MGRQSLGVRLKKWFRQQLDAPSGGSDTGAVFNAIWAGHDSGVWRDGDEIVYQFPRRLVRKTFVTRRILMTGTALLFIALDEYGLNVFELDIKLIALFGFLGYLAYEALKGKLFDDHPIRSYLHRKQSNSDLSRIRFKPDSIEFAVGDLSKFVVRRDDKYTMTVHTVEPWVEGKKKKLRLIEVERDGRRSTVIDACMNIDYDAEILTDLLVAWDQGFDRVIEYATAGIAALDDEVRRSKLLHRNPEANGILVARAIPLLLEPPSLLLKGEINLKRYYGDEDDPEYLHPEPETRPRLDVEFLESVKPDGRAMRFWRSARDADILPPPTRNHRRIEVRHVSKRGFVLAVVSLCWRRLSEPFTQRTGRSQDLS